MSAGSVWVVVMKSSCGESELVEIVVGRGSQSV